MFQGKQDSRGQQGKRETKETQALQDMPLRGRRESPASSWGPMEDQCTWGVWQENRATQAFLDLWDLPAQLVLRVQRERSGSQADRDVLA